MKRLLASVAVLFTTAALGVSGTTAPDSASRLTIEQLVDIRHPSNPAWSADGRQVTFTWDRAGVSARYVSDLDGRPPRQVPGAPAAGGGRGRGAAGASAEMDAVASPDGKRSAFVRTANGSISELWVRSAADGRESKLVTSEKHIGGVSWSPDSAFVVYTVGGGPIRHEQTPAYSGTKIIYTITENTQAQADAVAAAGGSPLALPAGGFAARRWLDARHVRLAAHSPDLQ